MVGLLEISLFWRHKRDDTGRFRDKFDGHTPTKCARPTAQALNPEMACELRSIFLVSKNASDIRSHDIIPVQNPMSIPIMAPVSIILTVTVAHVILALTGHFAQTPGPEPGISASISACRLIPYNPFAGVPFIWL